MQISLVKNGIFPITKDKVGNPLKDIPETGYSFPGTLQGEGKLAGIPVLFVRTSGCNLRCTWEMDDGDISICDTPYSSHYPGESEDWEIDEILNVLKNNSGNIRHVVISGGEPTLQPVPLTSLAKSIKKEFGFHITLETNGVLFIPGLTNWIDLFSISPKLSSSEPGKAKNKKLDKPIDDNYIRDHSKFRRNIKTLQSYINACVNLRSYYDDKPDTEPVRLNDKDFQLKFVISREQDIEEIKKDFLAHLSFVESEDIVLMPAGGNRKFLSKTLSMTARFAIQNGWRFTPRLQIDLFDDKQGV